MVDAAVLRDVSHNAAKLPSIANLLKEPQHQAQAQVSKPVLSPELSDAIDTLSEDRLRDILREICRENEAARSTIETKYLVPADMVVPYHKDDESEDDESEEGSEEEESDDEAGEFAPNYPPANVDNRKRKAADISVNPVPSGTRPRYAACENCEKEFDVTDNHRGDCVWHPGSKEADYASDVWADHDENCHGIIDQLDDDPEYEDGFLWDCCEELGSVKGCKKTKHKARDLNMAAKRLKH
ncbi:hypothetical protein BP6252_06562 [Coleophoma cylindrospora]|uniref:C2H2-type domain-containing protein n=1 Tax=Coleophoma cylindrospora TaxID=1849047 RepID=A0A3D8RN96_9HELO|nr:hypothetical protein BP6252_06562 [Coleophoma cylindrospora]